MNVLMMHSVVVTIVFQWRDLMIRKIRRYVEIKQKINHVNKTSNVIKAIVLIMLNSRHVKISWRIVVNVIMISNVNLILVEDIRVHILYRKSNT